MNKQNEKYKTMLRRKNKEKKIYKDKNSSLQFEKQKLYRALLNREQEIERLNNIIKDIKGQLNYLETYSSKEDVFEDMKRRLDRIESIVNRK